MQNGTALLLFSLPLMPLDAPDFIVLGKSSMPSCICFEVDARGACFLTICLLGKRCIITFVCGRGMAYGNRFIRYFESGCVYRWDVKLNQVQASLTAKVSKPSVCVALVYMTMAAKIKGRKRHLLVDTQGFVLK